jgi:hypothetical protein
VTAALEHLRADEERIIIGSKSLLAGAAEAGIGMTRAQERRVINELRPTWGALA